MKMNNLNTDDRIAILQLEAADTENLSRALSYDRNMIQAHLSLIENGKANIESLAPILCQTIQTLDGAQRHLMKNVGQIESFIREINQ